ncbi:MAG TPA: MurR/RpiR family transcriptional regulator [Dongiaceae bacterium]|nr:MurR/RpiR family transcriptional regulator [Dongiaceae bacterium]
MPSPKKASKSTAPAAGPSSIEERVRQELQALSEAERRVAHALLGEYPIAGLETVAKFAKRAGTSGPTILRFIGRLGFANYAEFQDALRSEIHISLQGPLTRYPTMPRGEQSGLFDQVTEAICKSVAGAAQNVRRGDFAQIVNRLSDLDRNIFLLGGRFSWMLASYFHHYLRELRPGTRIVRDSSAAWADYLLDVRKGDVLIVFDFRRYQKDVLEFARGAHAQGAEIVLITDIWYSPITTLAKFVLACPVSIPSAFDTGVPGLAMVEILTAGVIERLGGRAKDRIAGLETLRHNFKLGD